MGSETGSHRKQPGPGLLERDGELDAIASVLREAREGSGLTFLIEGPAGIGKTSLLAELCAQAEASGVTVLRARGAEMERDFGHGVLRQLFAARVEARGELLSGAAAMAAPIFGFPATGDFEGSAAEGRLYGLYWIAAALAEREPLVIALDDAHWADSDSLKFLRYLGLRLDGLPVLVALAARPDEPGAQAQALRDLVDTTEPVAVAPAVLSEGATTTWVEARLDLDEGAGAVASACHLASGGNPFLLDELLTALEADDRDEVDAERIAEMGPTRIARGVQNRAATLGPDAIEVLRAVAVLGDTGSTRTLAALAGVGEARVASLLDSLSAAEILNGGPTWGFLHPLLRTSVYEDVPTAQRARIHAEAARLLGEHGAAAEDVAAHLLESEPGTVREALETLETAAVDATARGAMEATVAYLRRALEEPESTRHRARLLQDLGHAEVSLRDPSGIQHLQESLELQDDPQEAIETLLLLTEVLSYAGMWDALEQLIDAGFERFGAADTPRALDLEATRAAYRGYDPSMAEQLRRDRPRLESLVDANPGAESLLLRAVLAALGSIDGSTREQVVGLCYPAGRRWSLERNGRESMVIMQAVMALLMVDELERCDGVTEDLLEDARRRGSVISAICARAFAASFNLRAGRLAAAEGDLRLMLDLVAESELAAMALTSFLHFTCDAIVERRGLEDVAAMVEGIEIPPELARTYSGAHMLEVKGAVCSMRGDRAGAVDALRAATPIYQAVGAGPRGSVWRSRLALALPESEREEALRWAREELALAEQLAYPRGVGVAQRTVGVLEGGQEGLDLLEASARALSDCPSDLERARTAAEHGALLRRLGRRADAREKLREAAGLAERCGAERLEERIDAELDVAGAKPRRRSRWGPDALTPAERRVAVAAAGGSTNREIAEGLFVSLRTVEMHLTSTFRKLDISRRAELADALGEARDSGK